MTKPPPIPPLLSVRTAVILLLGIVLGAVVGGLTYLAGSNVPAAVLACLMSAGGVIVFLHKELQ
ncbi:hypothetical protein ILP97_00960 [Amycolatopsis sp. H6(2020)]|nr:hypothetical protein [Amycolatopsis sp. H6(2020)]